MTGQPCAGYFQADQYHIGGEPLTVQAVRSLISWPQPGQAAGPGEVMVRGLAWSGAAHIARVEVSIGGQPWQPATLTGTPHPYGWQPCQLTARLEEPGSVTIWARPATTSTAPGSTSPASPDITIELARTPGAPR